MSTQSVVMKDEILSSYHKQRNTITLNSVDALAMVEHGGEFIMCITTPVGGTFRCKTAFIGTHSNSMIFAELPEVSNEDLEYYFQEGFWATIRAISPRGEGAVIHFRSQLQHIVKTPLPVVMMSIPNEMQISQLRKEPRFEVNLEAKANAKENSVECEIRDLSKSGCRFCAPPLSRPFQIGDEIALSVQVRTGKALHFEPLLGTICNLQRSHHYARYGVKFNKLGKRNAKILLSHLKFNGNKLTLSN